MSNPIVLVGTNHDYQWSDPCRTQEEILKFQNYLILLVQKHEVSAIAEEMDKESLNQHGQKDSIPFLVAQMLDKAHQYSNPTISEQSSLGIMNEGAIEYYGKYRNNWSEKEIKRRIELEYRKRESVWLKNIENLNQWPLLFICGSDHVVPFNKLLIKSGYLVIIEAENWAA